MWIKVAILVLMLCLIISLGTSFVFLMKDQGSSRRTLNSLGVRVSLAVALVALIAYGLYTGQLGKRAPWDRALDQKRAAETASQSKDINEQEQADPDHVNEVPVP